MRRIGHVENPRWRILRIAAFLSVVMIAVASSLAALHASSASAGGNILSAGQGLLAGQSLVSAGGQYALVMQTDGNLVVYGNGCVMWASNTAGTGSNNSLVMQTDGNLVVYVSGGKPVWASGDSKADQLCTSATMLAGQYLHSPSGQYSLVMQTDGNLVVYVSGGKPVWASNTAGTGSNNSLVMQTDGNLVVYASGGKPVWASNTAGTGSNNTLVMQDDSNLVVYASGGKPVWASKSSGSAIVNFAAAMKGKPYCLNGGSPSGPTRGDCASGTVGFDCTGLTLYAVFQATHILLPHGQGIENVKGGTLIASESQLQPGDIILFGGSITNYVHVGIYAGNGYMWDANTAFKPYPDGVQWRTVKWETGANKFDGAVRF
jgi:hypothetical protein